jgi:two-component system, OmpR family, alkaline phosphatase synthesis response regulator PhoP
VSASQGARVLLVEDEPNLARGIRENLVHEGYAVDFVSDGVSALAQVRAHDYAVVVLDVMLPAMDGFTVCETLRREGNDTPVLFLTAKGGAHDRIRGLEAGGDDYLPKPFHLKELLLRVAAIVRRRTRFDALLGSREMLRFGGNEFDFTSFRGRSWDGQEQQLTPKEALILAELAKRDGRVVWREDLLERVWGGEVLPSSRTIDNFIVKLRKRFEREPDRPRHFHTVRGVGYRFTAAGEDASEG